MKIANALLISLLLIGCESKIDKSKIKEEIRQAEANFEKMAKEKGIPEAFFAFADEAATINRGELIHGRKEILDFYQKAKMENVQLNWSPDSVFVSESTDLAYTYGNYKMIITDSLGQASSRSGIFHTIWKKQKDGGWKYIWD